MKRLKSLLYSQKLAPYVFVAPFVIVFLVFFLYPIISTVVMSFQSVVPGQTHFIGFENYRKCGTVPSSPQSGTARSTW